MKKLIVVFLCLSASLSLRSQELPTGPSQPTLSREEYLQKSKRQKTGAIVLISAGGAVMIPGAIMLVNNTANDFIFGPFTGEQSDNTVASILFATGAAAMLGSIPLFVSSHKNKKRAMELSFKNIPSSQVHKNMVINQQIPSINFRIAL